MSKGSGFQMRHRRASQTRSSSPELSLTAAVPVGLTLSLGLRVLQCGTYTGQVTVVSDSEHQCPGPGRQCWAAAAAAAYRGLGGMPLAGRTTGAADRATAAGWTALAAAASHCPSHCAARAGGAAAGPGTSTAARAGPRPPLRSMGLSFRVQAAAAPPQLGL